MNRGDIHPARADDRTCITHSAQRKYDVHQQTQKNAQSISIVTAIRQLICQVR
jgi:hypothetical protein